MSAVYNKPGRRTGRDRSRRERPQRSTKKHIQPLPPPTPAPLASPLQHHRHNHTHNPQNNRRNLQPPTLTLLRILHRSPLIVPVTSRNHNHKPIVRKPTVHRILRRHRIAPERALDSCTAGRISAPLSKIQRRRALEEEVDGRAAALLVALGGAIASVVRVQFCDAEICLCCRRCVQVGEGRGVVCWRGRVLGVVGERRVREEALRSVGRGYRSCSLCAGSAGVVRLTGDEALQDRGWFASRSRSRDGGGCARGIVGNSWRCGERVDREVGHGFVQRRVDVELLSCGKAEDRAERGYRCGTHG